MIYREIARLHIECIEDGFLPTLGEAFLALLYESIDADPNSVLIIENKNDRLIGFVAGGYGMRSIYSKMLKQWPRLFCTLLPSFCNPFKLKKFLRLFLTILTKVLNFLPTKMSFSVFQYHKNLEVKE